jgi:hypothetical protein
MMGRGNSSVRRMSSSMGNNTGSVADDVPEPVDEDMRVANSVALVSDTEAAWQGKVKRIGYGAKYT